MFRMQANIFTAVFSTGSYAYALMSLTSYWAFLVPSKSLPSTLQGVLYNMDTAQTTGTLKAILVDIGLMALFTIPHSTLAREATKKLMKLPQCVERSLFVFQSAALLHTQMYNWKNFEAPIVWDLSGLFEKPLWILFVFGFLFLVSASFALDHFHLFGLSQGMGVNINKKVGLAPPSTQKLVARWHYALVAHPIMTGILTFLWATPIMTVPHLLLSTFNTLYIMGAVILLEEPSLKKEIGKEYSDYLDSVNRFCPAIKKANNKFMDISLCPHFAKKKLDSSDAIANHHLDTIEHSPNINKAKAA